MAALAVAFRQKTPTDISTVTGFELKVFSFIVRGV